MILDFVSNVTEFKIFAEKNVITYINSASYTPCIYSPINIFTPGTKRPSLRRRDSQDS